VSFLEQHAQRFLLVVGDLIESSEIVGGEAVAGLED
jgi:hypothetical protein